MSTFLIICCHLSEESEILQEPDEDADESDLTMNQAIMPYYILTVLSVVRFIG